MRGIMIGYHVIPVNGPEPVTAGDTSQDTTPNAAQCGLWCATFIGTVTDMMTTPEIIAITLGMIGIAEITATMVEPVKSPTKE
jgi:hypothetical protein